MVTAKEIITKKLNKKSFLDKDGYGLVIKIDDLHTILKEELGIDIYFK